MRTTSERSTVETAVSKKAQQSAKTREALLATCLQLFAERGFTSTSIDEIARAAGVTKGAMYWHFASKEELFQAILDRIRGRWQEVVHAPVSARDAPLERIAQLFDSYAELFRQSPEICLFMQQVLLDQHNKLFSAQVAKVFSKTARPLHRHHHRGWQTGRRDQTGDRRPHHRPRHSRRALRRQPTGDDLPRADAGAPHRRIEGDDDGPSRALI